MFHKLVNALKNLRQKIVEFHQMVWQNRIAQGLPCRYYAEPQYC